MDYLLSHEVSQSDSIGSPGVNTTTGQASSYLSYASSVLKHDGKNGRLRLQKIAATKWRFLEGRC